MNMNGNLPTGTVSFLFTDIEGSTGLAQAYPADWESWRERHHAILQSAIELNGGYVFQIIGDAFCAAFHTACDGLRAAVDAQRRLQSEDWGQAPIKVRMGLHTGSAEITGADYRGYLTLAKVQRIMSLAYGGQVLLSNASGELLNSELPGGLTLRDLNEHRLKGFRNLERIWQIVAPGLQQDFPPLQSNDETPNNLPSQLTNFIGRQQETAQIKKRLEQNRLVTLTGSGGIGKTRLAIHVASEVLDEYPHGVWLVELAALSDSALVTQAVCVALDVSPQSRPPLDVLVEYLASKKVLLVMDNCEHLIEACALVAEALLRSCPNVRILASSREALGIDGEAAYRVPSLSLPDLHSVLYAIAQSESVKLFTERAAATHPDFELSESNAPIVAQICRRLDGIALAIELAASRVRILSVEQIAARLDDAFRLLTGGRRTALPRQQTLRALIDWSYNLLSGEERSVLRSLSVFMGGWNLEAAEAVCGTADTLDLLTHLVDKSLVAVDLEHDPEPRYYLLETIRQFAREKLAESGEAETIRARHLNYFLKLAQRAEPELYAAGQTEWSQNLEDEYENMHAALEWSLQGNLQAGQQLAAALWWAWDYSGHFSEGYEWLTKMLAAAPDEKTIARAQLLTGAGWIAALLGYGEQLATRFCEESIRLYRELGEETGAGMAFSTLAVLAYYRSDWSQAETLGKQSLELYQQANNKYGIRHILGILGYTVEAQGRLDDAWKYYEEALSISNEIGEMQGAAFDLYLMANFMASQGNYERAEELFEQALAVARAVKEKPITAWVLKCLGQLLMRRGDYERSQGLFAEALETSQRMGDQSAVAFLLNSLGWSARLQGQYPQARVYYNDGLRLVMQLDNQRDTADYLVDTGLFFAAQGRPEKFVRLLGMAESSFQNYVETRFNPFMRAEIEECIVRARTSLGEDAYAAAWKCGKQTTLDEGVNFALRELQNGESPMTVTS
jgi:predicted ATPase/class 3 adenylate cyclase/Tfp pilus assembly protein PilF